MPGKPRRMPRPLPVVRETPGGHPGRWRAAVLIGVHLLVALHLVHWRVAGETLSPVEPSEAMQLATEGVLNAGAIFFGLTLLSTLVLGRWFCGWACHLVALQDGARALLLRLGITPRPLRSRALLLVPLLAAVYMFVAPFLQRAWRGADLAPRAVHLTTTDFWATFPTWPVALATFFVCGFAAVLFLGSKGFCTYACPYGALFGLADRLAPGRIRVTDACNACGRCTSVCSSNVLVHAEVRDHGMVVDPGCMKCLDCVNACPTGALYYGFGRPALGAPRTAQALDAPRKPAFGRGEELVLALAFAAAFLAFRGLYDLVPFLFALGLAGVAAFAAHLALRLARRPDVKLLRWHLRRGGRLEPRGRAFLAAFALLVAFGLHSAVVQAATFEAQRVHDATAAIRPSWAAQLADPAGLDDAQRALVRRGLACDDLAARVGLLESPRADLRRAWFHLLLGEDAAVEAAIDRALRALPDAVHVRRDRAAFLASRGRFEEAVDELRRARAQPELAALAALLRERALAELKAGARGRAEASLLLSLRAERHVDALVTLAWLLDKRGERERAQALLDEAKRLQPR